MKKHTCPKCSTDFPCDVPVTPEGQKWRGISHVAGSVMMFILLMFLLSLCNASTVTQIIHGT